MTQPQLAKNFFTGIPVEYHIPKNAKVVFVSDFFSSDLMGGAELTTDAIVQTCPAERNLKPFKIHSTSLTPTLLSKNSDKHFVVGNFTRMPSDAFDHLCFGGFSYSVIEYDFKYCSFRSEYRHQTEVESPCNCPETVHGQRMEKFYRGAKARYWMSQKQKEFFCSRLPNITSLGRDKVVGSVFSNKTLDLLKGIRESTTQNNDTVAVLAPGGSWIKGIEQTVAWCKANNKSFVHVGNNNHEQFLRELGRHGSLAFMPLDKDTCPRVVIEAKLLGMNLFLNENVLHKDEPWFAGSVEDTDKHLRTNAQTQFWQNLELD